MQVSGNFASNSNWIRLLPTWMILQWYSRDRNWVQVFWILEQQRECRNTCFGWSLVGTWALYSTVHHKITFIHPCIQPFPSQKQYIELGKMPWEGVLASGGPDYHFNDHSSKFIRVQTAMHFLPSGSNQSLCGTMPTIHRFPAIKWHVTAQWLLVILVTVSSQCHAMPGGVL